MRTTTIFALGTLLAAPGWSKDAAKVNVDLPALERKAEAVVEVNLEGDNLEQGSRLLSIRQGVSNSVKGFLGGLKGIYRRTYRFAKETVYGDDDVAPIHRDLSAEGWSPTIDVKDRAKRESVTVYSYYENGAVKGVTVVSSDPSEFTIVNIVGDVDLEALAAFGHELGMPAMRLSSTELEKLRVKLPALPPQPKQR